jgi:hypothetical protein
MVRLGRFPVKFLSCPARSASGIKTSRNRLNLALFGTDLNFNIWFHKHRDAVDRITRT